MKRNLIIGTIIALIATSCGTSVQMSGRYIDDLYYWPGDAPLLAAVETLPEIGTANQPVDKDLLIISEAGTNSDGTKTLNNYIYADEVPDWYTDVQGQNLESLDPSGEDTLMIPSEDGETYIVNNYYMDDNFSYSDRIRRFHDPYYYDPYWNFSFNWGWGYPYYSSYHRWNSWYWDPWYGSSWYYDPWYYDPWYHSWGYSPYYSSWYWGGGYYGGYSPYYYHPHHYNRNHWSYYAGYEKKDNYDGERQSRRPNALYQGAGGAVSAASATRSREYTALEGPTTNKSIQAGSSRRVVNEGELTSSTQKSTTTTVPQTSTRNVLTEKRRISTGVPSNGSNGRSTTIQSGNTGTRTAPATSVRSNSTPSQPRVISGGSSSSGTRSTYTPSYNKPRTNTRSTYNTNRATGSDLKSYSVPSESNRSYSAPSQSRSTRSTYQIPSTRSESGSSSGTPSPTYRSSSPSQNSSGYSSSSPSRSSSSYSSPSSSGSSRSSYSTPSSGSSRSSYSSGSSSGSSRSYSSGSSSSGSSRSYSSGSSGSSGSSSSGSSRSGRR